MLICICVCVYIYIYLYLCVCICICVYIYTYMYAYLYIYIYILSHFNLYHIHILCRVLAIDDIPLMYEMSTVVGWFPPNCWTSPNHSFGESTWHMMSTNSRVYPRVYPKNPKKFAAFISITSPIIQRIVGFLPPLFVAWILHFWRTPCQILII